MNTNRVQSLRSRREQQPITLTSCPLCLRVLRGSDWVEAERVIRDIRSYELAAPPRLEWTVCELQRVDLQPQGSARRADRRVAGCRLKPLVPLGSSRVAQRFQGHSSACRSSRLVPQTGHT